MGEMRLQIWIGEEGKERTKDIWGREENNSEQLSEYNSEQLIIN